MAALFITFEGGEGAGKSTQVARLTRRLEDAGRDAVATREPGGSPGAERIRDLLVRGDADRWSPVTETLLMYAARRDHIERVIRPALARGAVVVCDRFIDSTRAYQGAGGGAPDALIAALESQVLDHTWPDLTLVFDIPVEVSQERVAGAREQDKFERQSGAFFTRVRETYLQRARAEPQRMRVIDATRSRDAIRAELNSLVAGL